MLLWMINFCLNLVEIPLVMTPSQKQVKQHIHGQHNFASASSSVTGPRMLFIPNRSLPLSFQKGLIPPGAYTQPMRAMALSGLQSPSPSVVRAVRFLPLNSLNQLNQLQTKGNDAQESTNRVFFLNPTSPQFNPIPSESESRPVMTWSPTFIPLTRYYKE